MPNFIQNLKNLHIPFFSSMNVYFDMGTAVTRIGIKDKGVVLREPTYLGYNTKIKEYIFFGQEAKSIVGKIPNFITIVRPVVNGILSDFDAEVAFIKKCVEKSVDPYYSRSMVLKPTLRAIACTPSIATEIEQKAVQEVLEKAGVSKVYVMEKPLATAAGCGFDIFSHEPHFIIDLGAGLIELSIVSGGGIISQKTIRNGGDHMNKVIANYLYMKHSVVVGEQTCEELKIELLNFAGDERTLTVRGKSLETGLPKSIRIKTSDIKEALTVNFSQIIDAAKELLELSPPEIADEVFKNGITIAGNLAKVEGIDDYLSKELNVEVAKSQHYADATIYGLMHLDKRPDDFFKLFGYK